MAGIRAKISMLLVAVSALTSCLVAAADDPPRVFAGASEQTPSRSEFFTWINNVNEGSTAQQTLTNLSFFDWLKHEYGAQLDIYAWDVGQIDTGGSYGSMTMPKFKAHYPDGFGPIAEKAKSLGITLGLWAGPDGFGNTPADEQARIDMMLGLVRDFGIGLFKMDTYCTELRPEKQDAFIRMMSACRAVNPNLILLNHRVNLGKAMPYATTSLWEGAETYIDVWMSNNTTASHHRAGALSRGLPPNLTRLVEDHGVCISSCLDYWEDDLVLQAFNRSLLLAPEIYGNPWLLRDDEYPRLARFLNLHHRFGDLLVQGIVLPESRYGPNAVSRGDGSTRLITLRNLTWNPVTYRVKLGDEIGLTGTGNVSVRRLHPAERDMGSFAHGTTVEIEVKPFRSCLLLASTHPIDELGVSGSDYEVVRDSAGKPALIKLLGMPGSQAEVKLLAGAREFSSATLDGKPVAGLLRGDTLKVKFPGMRLQQPFHRKLAALAPVDVPADSEALYEATCFAADNNALEIRQLARSGPSRIPEVNAAREAFLKQPDFINRGVWDRALFDDNPSTVFRNRVGKVNGLPVAALRLDFGGKVAVDRLVMDIHGDAAPQTAEVSSDLKSWVPAELHREGDRLTVRIPGGNPVRYVRLAPSPEVVAEINGFSGAQRLDRSRWRASNLFGLYSASPATSAWATTIKLTEAARGSYLCIALNGNHGVEGAYVAVRSAGRLIGAPDRSVSFLSNTWEYGVHQTDSNYTYYVPITPDMLKKPLDIVALTLRHGHNEYQPEVWISTNATPYESHVLELKGKTR
jgi:hypothetical protein